MSDSTSGAANERIARIVGSLQVDASEIEQLSREATSDNQRFIAINGVVIVAAVAAALLNFLEGEGVRSLLMPSVMGLAALTSLIGQTTLRRQRIAEIRKAYAPGSQVKYELGPSVIEIQSEARSTRLFWSECRSFEESAHAFLLHTGRVAPEILAKRAFGEPVLRDVRERLSGQIKKRALGRALAVALAMGFAVLAFGIVIAIAARATHH